MHEILPADVAGALMGCAEQALKSGQLQTVEYRLHTLAGELRDFEARVVRVREDEVLAIVRDVTEYKRRAGAARDSRPRRRGRARGAPAARAQPARRRAAAPRHRQPDPPPGRARPRARSRRGPQSPGIGPRGACLRPRRDPATRSRARSAGPCGTRPCRGCPWAGRAGRCSGRARGAPGRAAPGGCRDGRVLRYCGVPLERGEAREGIPSRRGRPAAARGARRGGRR